MPEDQPSLPERRQVQTVLELYRHHPHTTGRVRKADRLLARDLYRRGIGVDHLRDAFLLVAARRARSPEPPPTIRSLHYFLPAIQEVLEQPLDSGYVRYLRRLKQRDNKHPDHR